MGYQPKPKFTFKVKRSDNITGTLTVIADNFDKAYNAIKNTGYIVLEQVQTPEPKPPIFR